jgi:hypothetical protein
MVTDQIPNDTKSFSGKLPLRHRSKSKGKGKGKGESTGKAVPVLN